LNFFVNRDELKKAPFHWWGDVPLAINVLRIKPELENGRTTWKTVPETIEHVATFMWSTQSGVLSVLNNWFECPKGRPAQFVIQPASTRNMDLYWFELDYPAQSGGAHGIVLEMHT
jgi:hypothetical protein